jgi:hypothetical protein
MTRKKFQIFYPEGHGDSTLAGKQYKPTGKNMLVMNNEGIFFVYNGETYYPSIRKLSDVIGKYNVKWNDKE